MFNVFVYGTLKPGEVNYQRYCQGRLIDEQPAIARGRLFALPMGYPALIGGTNRVQGVLLRFSDRQLLEDLDRLEGYFPQSPLENNHYLRQSIPVFQPTGVPLGDAFAYLMTWEQVKQYGGVELLTGYWSSLSD